MPFLLPLSTPRNLREPLPKAADDAFYAAKRGGRNRAVGAGDTDV